MDYQMTRPNPVSAQADEEERAIAERTQAREAAQAAQAAAKGGASQPMRIRNDYVPRAQAKRQNVAMALCPNCKQQIPYEELDHHMKGTSPSPSFFPSNTNTFAKWNSSTHAGKNSDKSPTSAPQPPTCRPRT